MLLATVVAVITSAVVANATQTITTPNAAFISFNLAASANSAVITPVTNKSVLVMGCGTTSPVQAVGQVSLLHIPSSGIQWAGYESFGPVAFTGNSTSTAGTHIVYIDSSHLVDIRVASADTILIHNSSPFVRTGNVTLVW